MNHSFYHGFDHRNGHGISGLFADGAIVADNLKAVREALEPQQFSGSQTAVAVNQQIIVGRASP